MILPEIRLSVCTESLTVCVGKVRQVVRGLTTKDLGNRQGDKQTRGWGDKEVGAGGRMAGSRGQEAEGSEQDAN